MNAAGRLALYGGGLAVAFGAAFLIAGAIAPDNGASTTESHGDHDTTQSDAMAASDVSTGLSSSGGGVQLSNLTAPVTTGTSGDLSFQILSADGTAITQYDIDHDAELHLIVVRADGSEFRHVHPELESDTWSLPWQWDAAGTYRVYADFVPTGGEALTLSQTVQVSGNYSPVMAEITALDEVDGFTVAIDGTLTPGSTSNLTLSIARDGEPVTDLEPYLGAFGHLVALRDGDLAYLHVHPEGDEPAAGDAGGPTIEFAAEVPTAGRYLLYLDFQVDGTVHTAEFVIDAEHGEADAAEPAASEPAASEPADEHGSHDDH